MAMEAAGGGQDTGGTPVPLLGKWWLVGLYWLLQTALVMIGGPLIAGDVQSPSDVVGVFTDRDYAPPAAVTATALIFFQAVFMWPVRRPSPAQSRGWPLRISLAVAGAGAALLFLGLLWGVAGAIELAGGDVPGVWLSEGWWIGFMVAGWAVATPLLIAFCRRGPRETLLGRVAARLFLGTIVEVIAVIPLDVMIRRRTDCYCWAPTFYTLLICAGVGMFALGPAIWLPLLARRRTRWYAGKCDVCAYDMSGTPDAERCPECGAGWKQLKGADQPANQASR
jgi:hypothetical protein